MDDYSLRQLEKRVEKRYQKRDKKKRKHMKVSGKSVFKLQEIIRGKKPNKGS